jgi:TolB-like protein/DNA-binding winged helix-turn-helix (wHTH) protein/Tfp pilus assembly protein PilF
MSLLISHFYQFGEFTLDADQRVLLRAGKPLAIPPKVFDTLLILVENGGRLTGKDDLMRQLWPDTFVEEANLTYNVQQLRKLLGDDARRPRYIETVARRGYRFVAAVEEVLSDARLGSNVTQRLESPPPQTAPGGRVPHSGPVTAREGEAATPAAPAGPESAQVVRAASGAGLRVVWKAFAVAAALVVVAACGWLLWRGSPPPPAPDERLMLAVLPFRNLTGDAGQDYFSEGLTEEMIAQLGSLNPQRFGVVARSSVMHYKDSREPLDRIGRELGVQYVLEGSVRRDADSVRVTTRLVQVRDQTPVWSRQYDRQLRGLLSLQREIGQEVVGQIRLALGDGKPGAAAPEPPLSARAYEAHDLWLRGQYFWNRRTVADFQKAVEYFQRAADTDPTYARAYVGLANCYALMGGYTMRPQSEFMPKARAAALRAVELDENSAEAHTALALIVQNYDLDWRKAEEEFRRAIELNPSYATAHHWYAEHLMWRGRFDEALRESDEARRLDPHSLIIAADHGAILYYARQYDRAIQQFRAVRELDPNFQRCGLIVHVYDQKGLFAEALADIEAHPPPSGMSPPWYWSELAYVYGRSGQQAQAAHALEKLLELNRRQEVGAEAIIWAYLGVGNNDQALAWLEKAYAQRSPALTYLKVDPRYDPLRGDPRFQGLLRRAGLGE